MADIICGQVPTFEEAIEMFVKPTQKKGIDWSKKDMYDGIGRPDLKPENKNIEGCEYCGHADKTCHECQEKADAYWDGQLKGEE